MREGMQVRLKTITITIFWEGREGERGTFGFMLAVVVVVGVIVDFVVIVNDDDISVNFSGRRPPPSLAKPCSMQFFNIRPTIYHPFDSTRLIPLYSTNPTLLHQSHFTTPVSLYSTHLTLPCTFCSTPFTSYYLIQNTKTNKKYKQKQK